MLYNWLGKKYQWRWERSIDRRILSITRLPANARKKEIQGWNPDINQEEYRDKHLIASFSIVLIVESNVTIKRCHLFIRRKAVKRKAL